MRVTRATRPDPRTGVEEAPTTLLAAAPGAPPGGPEGGELLGQEGGTALGGAGGEGHGVERLGIGPRLEEGGVGALLEGRAPRLGLAADLVEQPPRLDRLGLGAPPPLERGGELAAQRLHLVLAAGIGNRRRRWCLRGVRGGAVGLAPGPRRGNAGLAGAGLGFGGLRGWLGHPFLVGRRPPLVAGQGT